MTYEDVKQGILDGSLELRWYDGSYEITCSKEYFDTRWSTKHEPCGHCPFGDFEECDLATSKVKPVIELLKKQYPEYFL